MCQSEKSTATSKNRGKVLDIQNFEVTEVNIAIERGEAERKIIGDFVTAVMGMRVGKR